MTLSEQDIAKSSLCQHLDEVHWLAVCIINADVIAWRSGAICFCHPLPSSQSVSKRTILKEAETEGKESDRRDARDEELVQSRIRSLSLRDSTPSRVIY